MCIRDSILRGLLPDDNIQNDKEENTVIREAVTQLLVQEVQEVQDVQVESRVSPDEFDDAVARQKSGKAPGLDGIKAEIVKRTISRIRLLFLDIVNKMFQSGEFPKSWKRGVLKIFLKSKDKDPQDIKSYRPVTLLPVLGKTAERLIVFRLENFLENINFYGESQFGFRRGRGTSDAILSVRGWVETSVRRYVLGVFLDISGCLLYTSRCV